MQSCRKYTHLTNTSQVGMQIKLIQNEAQGQQVQFQGLTFRIF